MTRQLVQSENVHILLIIAKNTITNTNGCWRAADQRKFQTFSDQRCLGATIPILSKQQPTSIKWFNLNKTPYPNAIKPIVAIPFM